MLRFKDCQVSITKNCSFRIYNSYGSSYAWAFYMRIGDSEVQAEIDLEDLSTQQLKANASRCKRIADAIGKHIATSEHLATSTQHDVILNSDPYAHTFVITDLQTTVLVEEVSASRIMQLADSFAQAAENSR